MARNYYTVCEFDLSCGKWFDVFGTYSLTEAKSEADGMGAPRGCVTIIKHDDTAAAMMAERDALPLPARIAKLKAKVEAAGGAWNYAKAVK